MKLSIDVGKSLWMKSSQFTPFGESHALGSVGSSIDFISSPFSTFSTLPLVSFSIHCNSTILYAHIFLCPCHARKVKLFEHIDNCVQGKPYHLYFTVYSHSYLLLQVYRFLFSFTKWARSMYMCSYIYGMCESNPGRDEGCSIEDSRCERRLDFPHDSVQKEKVGSEDKSRGEWRHRMTTPKNHSPSAWILSTPDRDTKKVEPELSRSRSYGWGKVKVYIYIPQFCFLLLFQLHPLKC